MKYLVVSDIHGVKKYAEIINEIALKERVDKIILLGDLYYHENMYELSNNYMDIVNILNKLKDKIICIRGNCDNYKDEEVSEFKFNDYVILNINNKNFFFTHGHKYNIYNIPSGIDVFIFGHLHTSFIKKVDDILYINCGSISLPRRNTKNSYLIIDEKEIILYDVNGDIIDKVVY